MRMQGVRDRQEVRPELLDLLAAGDPPAFATDHQDRIIFWNRGAEQLLGRGADEVLGRLCYEVVEGRDVFGNRFCHADCAVVTMTRGGEPVQRFEMQVAQDAAPSPHLSVTIIPIPSRSPELFTVVHLLAGIEPASQLARALASLGATQASEGIQISTRSSRSIADPTLTKRERMVLMSVASGLQNKEIASKLGISLSTVRNHIQNILEKLGVHSKLEAVSLAFHRGWVESEDAPRHS